MRVILAVLDSFGIGGAPDAARFGDDGANTLGHIAQACPDLALPHMASLGLYHALEQASGLDLPKPHLIGIWAAATEQGLGKDTPSGHWEIAGFPVTNPPRVFKDRENSFPSELLDQIVNAADIPGYLGNKHASGMPVLAEFGAEHLQTSKPIIYTSTDSVMQIAAHEETFGLDRLMVLCTVARDICNAHKIGRVIARPFIGDAETGYIRTGNRRDFTMPPSGPTLLDHLQQAGRQVIGVGKIGDIFANRGLSETRKAHGNMAMFDTLLGAVDDLQPGGLAFANFVDFDTLYGHARDPQGYARALEEFDARLPALLAALKAGDLLILTADHGNDPTWRGTDHTREQVPVLIHAPGRAPGTLGSRNMADLGATIADYLNVVQTGHGASFLNEMEELK